MLITRIHPIIIVCRESTRFQHNPGWCGADRARILTSIFGCRWGKTSCCTGGATSILLCWEGQARTSTEDRSGGGRSSVGKNGLYISVVWFVLGGCLREEERMGIYGLKFVYKGATCSDFLASFQHPPYSWFYFSFSLIVSLISNWWLL